MPFDDHTGSIFERVSLWICNNYLVKLYDAKYYVLHVLDILEHQTRIWL